MTENARSFAMVLGLAGILGGIAIMIASGLPGGIPLVVLGLMILASVVFDRRYRQPGDAPPIAGGDWQPTGERFVDDQTGQPVEVWMDSLTGARRYEPIRQEPHLPEPRP